ncbi:hypothetical protein BHE74_00032930 [Ensete ventricosum]|nr:hypothetical protein BHE74_00032930 [Ensete ventricosum]
MNERREGWVEEWQKSRTMIAIFEVARRRWGGGGELPPRRIRLRPPLVVPSSPTSRRRRPQQGSPRITVPTHYERVDISKTGGGGKDMPMAYTGGVAIVGKRAGRDA